MIGVSVLKRSLFLATAVEAVVAAVFVQYPCRRPRRLFPPVCPIICITTNYIFATLSPSSVFGLIFTVFLAFHLSFFRFCFWINLQWPPQADKLRVQGKVPLSLQQLGELFPHLLNPTTASSERFQSYYGLDGCPRLSYLLSFYRISTSTTHTGTAYTE